MTLLHGRLESLRRSADRGVQRVLGYIANSSGTSKEVDPFREIGYRLEFGWERG
jgi:hypothetical protein